MHIVTTAVRLEAALETVDAPRRQTASVAEWGRCIAAAVVAGHACGSSAGTTVDPAWRGDITHRGFIDTCQAIIQALRAQESAAEAARLAAEAAARAAENEDDEAVALAKARRAADWRDKAMHAESAGIGLVSREDALLRPVGDAVAVAGGVTEVAREKTYHQGGRR